MTERWLPVVGYAGLYEVSDLGRVRSLTCATSAGRVSRKTPRLLKGGSAPEWGNYPSVVLFDAAGCRKKHFRHLLVAEAFLGPRPHPNAECRHDDGDPLNSALSNLLWGTAAQNQQDRVRHGTDVRGIKHPKAKLSNVDAAEIKRRLDAGETGVSLAKQFGVSRSLVSGLNTGKLRPWLGA